MRSAVFRVIAIVAVAAIVPARAIGAERYALVVIGASGEPKFAENYDGWRATLTTILRERLTFADDHLTVLAERASPGVERSTRDAVRQSFAAIRSKLQPDDLLFVILIGHGTFDGEIAKFNIVGPDLTATEWSELFGGLPGTLVIVNTTGASFPFLAPLSARGRVVVTATDSVAQRYETVFPQFFIEAFDDGRADADKNGRVSIWEAFTYASQAVRQWYEQRGQLSTERPLLDDNGDGTGKEAGAPGADGALARTTYLDSGVAPTATGDAALTALIQRRAALEQAIEELKARKASMSPDDFAAEFEKLVTELAKVSRDIRSRS